MVLKSQVTQPQPESKFKTTSATAMAEQMASDGAEIKGSTPSIDETKNGTRHHRKAVGLGLRAKMILLFFFIPSILTAGVSLFYLGYFDTASRLFLQESAKIVTQRTEQRSADHSTATAVMQSRPRTLTGKARTVILVMLGAAILLIGIIVLVYANRLTGKIESLTDVADRISAGDLEMEIVMKSRDEIGELAQAIARLRDNIRLYIERLRQRP
jgi:HAMP domain-containing protein